MTFAKHTCNNENAIRNSLIELSDTSHKWDSTNEMTVCADWDEAVSGWKPVVPYAKYVPQQPKRPWRKTGEITKQTETNELVAEKMTVRCVGDDFDAFPVAPWKANVEQGTYRYVPNNGCYRTMKFLWDERREWYSVNKKQPEKVTTTWQQRQFQKEVKRQLYRDLGNRAQKVDSEEKKGLVSNVENERSLSTQSDGALQQGLYTHEFETQSDESSGRENETASVYKTTVPQIDVAPSSISKSASDLFIETISSRMNVFDEEIRRDSKIMRSDGIKSPSKTKCLFKDKEATPRLPPRKECLTQDLFTIRSVRNSNPELRPLEKLTPHYRQVGDLHRMSVAQSRFGSNAPSNCGDVFSKDNESEDSVIPLGSSELERTLNSYKMAIESTKQSIFNTLTGTKIYSYGSRRMSSKNFTTPSTITICDSGTSVSGRTSVDGTQSAPVGQQKEREKATGKDPLAIPTGILPEVSGKRLEVASSNHRWL